MVAQPAISKQTKRSASAKSTAKQPKPKPRCTIPGSGADHLRVAWGGDARPRYFRWYNCGRFLTATAEPIPEPRLRKPRKVTGLAIQERLFGELGVLV